MTAENINDLIDKYFNSKDGNIKSLTKIFTNYQQDFDNSSIIKSIIDYYKENVQLEPEIEQILENQFKISGMILYEKIFKEIDNDELINNYSKIINEYLNDSKQTKIIEDKLSIRKTYEEYYNSFPKNTPLEYIIFYEAPPENIDNYLLNNPKNSHYANVLKKFFSPNNDVNNIADLLQEKGCLFVDILDIPIKLDKKKYPYIRLFWSLLTPPFTYLLFKQKIMKLHRDGLIGNNTRVAIGMPPNSSLGIYNYLPQDKAFYTKIKLDTFYENLTKGNDEINTSKEKFTNYPKQRFNSHKSNVSIGQNPSYELLKYAWN